MLSRLYGVLLPFFVSFLIAYMLDPVVEFVQHKCKVQFRGLSVTIVLLLFVALISLSVYVIIPAIGREVKAAAVGVEQYFANFDADKYFTPEQQEIAQTLFHSQIPAVEKAEFMVSFAAMSPDDKPVVITQAEYMRRMKEMARFQPGMSFYGEMPNMYSLVLNTKHPLVQKIVDQAEKALDAELKPVNDDITATQNVVKAIRDLKKDNKELPEDKKKDLEDNEKHLDELRNKKKGIITAYAAGESRVHQLIDIALLSNNMLKGEGLDRFLKRSIGLLK